MIPLLLLLAAPDLSGMLKLSNGSSLAHACPVAMDKAYTNRHVVTAGSQGIWGVGNGEDHHGLYEAEVYDVFRDLAVIKPISSSRFPRWYPIAFSAPKVGEKVYFIGYDWEDRKSAFAPKVFDSTVTRIFNGNLAFEKAGRPGSSGSCILNERGEVLAINQGGNETDTDGLAGIGVGIWGDWLNLRKDEPVVKEPEPSYEGYCNPLVIWRVRGL